MPASVAIVIVNWNSYEVTYECLESLTQVAYDPFEVIVVDNGSSDDSGQRLEQEFPDFTFLFNPTNTGFTGGNNTGIQYGLDHGFDYVMLLNNDTMVTTDFLKILTDTIEQDDQAAAIQPKIMYDHDRSIIWNAGGRFKAFTTLTKTIGEGEKDTGQYDGPGETDWITGCCFMIRSSAVEEIGLLDNKFFIYFEDADWSLKLRRLGKKMLYQPGSVIYHKAGKSDSNRDKHGEGQVSPFAHYQGTRNHLFLVRRYARGLNWIGSWGYQAVKLTGYLLYFTLRGRFTKFKFVLKGIRDGLVQ